MTIFETEKQLSEFLRLNGRSNYSVKHIWDKLKSGKMSDIDIIMMHKRPASCTESI